MVYVGMAHVQTPNNIILCQLFQLVSHYNNTPLTFEHLHEQDSQHCKTALYTEPESQNIFHSSFS